MGLNPMRLTALTGKLNLRTVKIEMSD